MESIHSRIKRLRIEKGLSQAELATAAGVTYQSVQEWEREDGTAPARKRIGLVAAALGVKPLTLITDVIELEDEAAIDLPAREEIVLLLFRGLFAHQQKVLIEELRALFDANQYIRREMKLKTLTGVSNEQVAAAFGEVPPPKKKTGGRARRGRPASPHMGDSDVE